ncbi:MAG: LysR family transcriptional regulator [Granulosicoccaceae bacterium]
MSSKNSLLPRNLGDAHIRLLRIYKVVVESRGFAAAEIELNISRPAISMAIGELESLLQMRLCHRGRGGFSVTDEGRQVYDAALQLFAGLETFKSQINAINTELKGEFNIGITDNLVTLPQMRITHALAELKQRGPDICINIRMIPPNDIEAGVLEGTLHTGVVPELRRLPGLNYIELYQEESQLYCSAEHELYQQNTHKLSDKRLGEFDAVLPSYPQNPEIKLQQQVLKPAATSTDREGIAFLILTGQYIGFLPTHLAERWVEQGKMRALQPKKRKLVTSYSAVTRKGAKPNPNTEAYLEELLKR